MKSKCELQEHVKKKKRERIRAQGSGKSVYILEPIGIAKPSFSHFIAATLQVVPLGQQLFLSSQQTEQQKTKREREREHCQKQEQSFKALAVNVVVEEEEENSPASL